MLGCRIQQEVISNFRRVLTGCYLGAPMTCQLRLLAVCQAGQHSLRPADFPEFSFALFTLQARWRLNYWEQRGRNALSSTPQGISRPVASLLQVCDDTVEEDDGEGGQTLFRVVRIPFRVLFVTGNLKMRLHVEQDSKTGHVRALLTC